MEKISKYLKLETINVDLKSKDKKAVLRELFESLANSEEILDKEKCFEDIIEREKLGSTGIGNGFAVPHAKTSYVKDVIMTVGISKNLINYNSLDEEGVKIFFMFLTPHELAQEYLTLLAKIARFIKDEEFKEKLLNAKTQQEIYDIVLLKED